MKVIAFAASTNRQSINKQLAHYAAQQVQNAEVEVFDLNDYELPIFSQDKETEIGQPAAAQAFLAKVNSADALVISFAEHNGSYSAAYKNLFDWASRIQKKVYDGKPILALATSPGPGGAASVLASATQSLPHFGATVKASVSIPSFYDSFDTQAGTLRSAELVAKVQEAAKQLTL